jgi:hypothetical protein
MVSEVNSLLWPGPDVRPLADGSPYFGAIPDWLFEDAGGDWRSCRAGSGEDCKADGLKLVTL